MYVCCRYTQGLTSTLSESAVDDCVKGVAYQDTKDEDAINKTVGSSTNLLDLDEDGPTKISEDVEVSVKGDIGQLVNGGIGNYRDRLNHKFFLCIYVHLEIWKFRFCRYNNICLLVLHYPYFHTYI